MGLKWYNRTVDGEEAIKKVSPYLKVMHQGIKQVVKPLNQADNRDGQEDPLMEELHALVLPDLKFEDFTAVDLETEECKAQLSRVVRDCCYKRWV